MRRLGMEKLITLCIVLLFIPLSSFASDPWSQDRIIQTIVATAHKHHVSPALALAVAEIESSFNPQALRWEDHLETASVGLFQVLHSTAKIEFGFKGSIEALKNPSTNISYGVRYLKKCGSEDDLMYVACCYQAGFGADPVFCATHKGVQNYRRKLEKKVASWTEELADP